MAGRCPRCGEDLKWVDHEDGRLAHLYCSTCDYGLCGGDC